FHGRPVGRIWARVGPEPPPIGSDQKVPSGLEGVFPLWDSSNLGSPENKLRVPPQNSWSQKSPPGCSTQTERGIAGPVWVREQWEGQRLLGQVPGDALGPAHRNRDHLKSERLELRVPLAHLDQVSLARDSSEMAEEDQKCWPDQQVGQTTDLAGGRPQFHI